MGYRKSEQSTDTVFEVTPEDPPPFPTTFTVAGKIRAIVEIIIFTFILFLLVNLFLPRWIGMPVGTVLSFLLVRWIWKRGKLKERVQPTVMKNRVPSRFIVNPNGVTLNGTFFKKAEIHRVLTRNEVLDDLDHTVVTVSTSDSRMYQAGREAGTKLMLGWKREVARVSYHVELEAGGVPHVLAGGLTEAGAFAILSDVSGILGLK